MRLPSELVSLAVRGTNQQITQKYHQAADTTLRLCAVRALQRKAGFIPAQDHQALYTQCPVQSSTHINQEALKHLNLILKEHPLMLQEWLQVVCSVQKTLPDEYIPCFLSLGCDYPHLQKWLKLLMNDRADWLVAYAKHDNWNWYNNREAQSIDETMSAQNKDNWKTAHQINLSLAYDPLHWGDHKGLNRLKNYIPMWREQTARLLIDAMFVANVTASYIESSLIVAVVRQAAYHLPLNFADKFLSTLRMGHDNWHSVAEELEATFTLRHEMLAAILECHS